MITLWQVAEYLDMFGDISICNSLMITTVGEPPFLLNLSLSMCVSFCLSPSHTHMHTHTSLSCTHTHMHTQFVVCWNLLEIYLRLSVPLLFSPTLPSHTQIHITPTKSSLEKIIMLFFSCKLCNSTVCFWFVKWMECNL